MEEIKLTIAIPTAGMTCAPFAYSVAGLIAHTAARGMSTRPEGSFEMNMDVIESSVIHANREKLVERALASGRTHLLFIDDDMSFYPQTLEIMLGRRKPVVVANYLIKTDPPEKSEFVAVGLNGKRVPTTQDCAGLLPIAYSGFGFSLFETRVFKRIPQPWFMPVWNKVAKEYTTEDNPFFEKVRKKKFEVLLDQDASKHVSHMGRRAWNWVQWKPQPLTVGLKPPAPVEVKDIDDSDEAKVIPIDRTKEA